MKRSPGALFGAVVFVVGLGAAAAVRAGANDQNSCSTECPAGTRLSTIEVTEFTQAEAENGTFLYVTESCETFCEPVVPCILPNVPIVDAAGFRCQPLAGLFEFEPIDEIDFSFAEAWDPAQASVP